MYIYKLVWVKGAKCQVDGIYATRVGAFRGMCGDMDRAEFEAPYLRVHGDDELTIIDYGRHDAHYRIERVKAQQKTEYEGAWKRQETFENKAKERFWAAEEEDACGEDFDELLDEIEEAVDTLTALLEGSDEQSSL